MALRTLLRQDPDVIMVGEMRDEETARTAIQAALTGHLVLSTLHTNDARFGHHAAGQHGRRAVPDRRGAQRGAGAAAGAAHLPQVPRRATSRRATLRKALEKMGYEMEKFYRGVGCRKCRNTGYSGRLGIHELLIVDDELRDAIVADASIGRSAPHRRPQRHDHAPPRRLPQSPRRHHHDRRNPAHFRRHHGRKG